MTTEQPTTRPLSERHADLLDLLRELERARAFAEGHANQGHSADFMHGAVGAYGQAIKGLEALIEKERAQS